MLAPCGESNSTNEVAPFLTDVRSAASGSKTFYYTGAEQSFKVPSGVTSINVIADGAAGA